MTNAKGRIVAVLVAAGGFLLFWRRRRSVDPGAADTDGQF